MAACHTLSKAFCNQRSFIGVLLTHESEVDDVFCSSEPSLGPRL